MIYFPTENPLPNYKEFPSLYNTYQQFKGREVYSSYVYWILKNNGVKDIELVRNISNTTKEDIIMFHFDNLSSFCFNTPAKKIQFVSDKPLVTGCNLYLTSDLSVCNNLDIKFPIIQKKYNVNLQYFPEPLPVGLKKNNVNFPPKVAACMGLYENIDKDLLYLIEYKDAFLYQYLKNKKIDNKHIELIKDIKFVLYDKANNNKGDEDLFFFIRNKEAGFNYAGFKHPNRLFVSFYCNTPGFYQTEPALSPHRKSEYDYVEIHTASDFVEKLFAYVRDEQYFLNILKHIKTRESENDELAVVKYFKTVIQQLKT